jgi:TonB family protein
LGKPFVLLLSHLLKNSLKNVHEYLADAAVLRSVATPQYGRFLLHQNTQLAENVLFTNIFFSQLKKRILMMSRNSSQRRALLKYSFALPLFALLFVFFAAPNNVLLAKTEWLTPKADTLKPLNTPHQKLNPTASQLRTNKTPRGLEAAPTPKAIAHIATAQSDSTPQKKAAANPPQVDVMPHYQPNNDSLFAFLGRNIKYPEVARQVKAEGAVFVGFMVEKDGSITEISVKRGAKYTNAMQAAQGSLEKEALRVVSLMPKWKAGTLKGEPIRTSFVLPIKFKLD